MGKSKHKISNWKQYNQALVQRGSLTVWMDEQAIQQWHCQTHHGRRGRGFHYSDSAIETALMLKAVFKLPLRALEGFINSLFELMNVPLQSPDYSCISKRAKTVEIKSAYRAMAQWLTWSSMPPDSRSMARVNGKFASSIPWCSTCSRSGSAGSRLMPVASCLHYDSGNLLPTSRPSII